MRRLHLVILFVLLSVAAGCAPSRQEYEAIATVLQGSAKARIAFIADCVASFSARDRKGAAMILDVSEKDAPALACRRLVDAIASGRADYNDIGDMRRKKHTPKLIKIFQGR